MSQPAPGLNRARSFVPSSVPPVQPLVADLVLGPGPSSEPHIVLSPDVPFSAEPTSGFMFFLVASALTTLRIWKRESGTGIWALLVTFTPPDLAALKWITVCKVPASELYFETDATLDGGAQVPVVFIEEIGG